MGLITLYSTNYTAEYKMPPKQQNTLKIKRSFKRRRFMEENYLSVSMIMFIMTLVMIQNLSTAQAGKFIKV